jgi:hypothetical protein
MHQRARYQLKRKVEIVAAAARGVPGRAALRVFRVQVCISIMMLVNQRVPTRFNICQKVEDLLFGQGI